jgi:hypothetical protein
LSSSSQLQQEYYLNLLLLLILQFGGLTQTVLKQFVAVTDIASNLFKNVRVMVLRIIPPCTLLSETGLDNIVTAVFLDMQEVYATQNVPAAPRILAVVMEFVPIVLLVMALVVASRTRFSASGLEHLAILAQVTLSDLIVKLHVQESINRIQRVTVEEFVVRLMVIAIVLVVMVRAAVAAIAILLLTVLIVLCAVTDLILKLVSLVAVMDNATVVLKAMERVLVSKNLPKLTAPRNAPTNVAVTDIAATV